jgi:hypothetical protein
MVQYLQQQEKQLELQQNQQQEQEHEHEQQQPQGTEVSTEQEVTKSIGIQPNIVAEDEADNSRTFWSIEDLPNFERISKYEEVVFKGAGKMHTKIFKSEAHNATACFERFGAFRVEDQNGDIRSFLAGDFSTVLGSYFLYGDIIEVKYDVSENSPMVYGFATFIDRKGVKSVMDLKQILAEVDISQFSAKERFDGSADSFHTTIEKNHGYAAAIDSKDPDSPQVKYSVVYLLQLLLGLNVMFALKYELVLY